MKHYLMWWTFGKIQVQITDSNPVPELHQITTFLTFELTTKLTSELVVTGSLATTAWRVLRFRMEDTGPSYWAQLYVAHWGSCGTKPWYSSLGGGQAGSQQLLTMENNTLRNPREGLHHIWPHYISLTENIKNSEQVRISKEMVAV
jgi:hypothetical protein